MSFFVLSVEPGPNRIRAAMCRGKSLARYRLEFANHFWADSAWQLKRRRIETFHTIYCAEGHAWYRIADRPVSLEAGTLVVVGPDVEHSGGAIAGSRPHLVTARFVQEGAPKDGEPPAVGLASIEDPLWWAMTVQSVHRYEGFYIAMAKSWQHRDQPLCQASAGMLLNTILYESITELTRDRMGDTLIAEAVRYIDEHPGQPLLVSDLARRAGLSTRSFSSRFSSATGKTPTQYRILRRGQAARDLLTNSDLIIKEISATLGYANPFVFSRQFRQLYGISPTQFRRQHHHGGEPNESATQT